jgi:GH15 family glucan-1,4-alpha-glucosidase
MGAAHRGAAFARAFGRRDLAERWLAWAGPFRERILKEAYNESLGYFAQALNGEHADASNAADLFQELLAYENPLGLFSEDIDPGSGRLLGNFPQAYTHVGLIHAAITLGELRDARATSFRAWS